MGIDEQINDIQPLPYEKFEGRYIDAMPALRADGRVPLTVRQIAEKRLEAVASGNEQMIEGWLLNYFDTSDAIAYSGDEIKIVPDCELLKNIDSDAKLKNGSLVLSKNQYKQLPGKTFQRSDIKADKWLTEQEVKEHPVWQLELGDLLEPYAKMVFSERKKRWDAFQTGMGVQFDRKRERPTLSPFGLNRLYDGSSLKNCYLLDYCARLVGVRNEKIGEIKRSSD